MMPWILSASHICLHLNLKVGSPVVELFKNVLPLTKLRMEHPYQYLWRGRAVPTFLQHGDKKGKTGPSRQGSKEGWA